MANMRNLKISESNQVFGDFSYLYKQSFYP